MILTSRLKSCSRVFLFFMILLLIFHYTSYIFLPKDNLDSSGMKDISANGILSEERNTIDVLILGDSEAYSSFSPMEMYKQHGFTSYVCATSGQPLYYTKSLLERTLKDQNPSVVVVETDTIFRPFMVSEPITSKLGDIFPIFHYHDRWKTLKEDDLSGTVNYTYNNVLKGFDYSTGIKGLTDLSQYMKATEQRKTIPMLNQYFLDRIVKTCKDRGIELVFVSAPSPVNWDMAKHNRIMDYASGQGVTYLDLNLEPSIRIDWLKDTRDAGDHLNYTGAMKVTEYMGKCLHEHYDLHDHRQDKAYLSWNQSLDNYQKIIQKK